MIALIVSGQWLLLFKISGSSLNEPTQTLPKWPVSAIIRLSREVSCIAGNADLMRTRRIAARHRDGCGLVARAGGLKA